MYSYGYQYGKKTKRISEGQLIFDGFVVRVEADGGETENRECAINDLNNLV